MEKVGSCFAQVDDFLAAGNQKGASECLLSCLHSSDVIKYYSSSPNQVPELREKIFLCVDGLHNSELARNLNKAYFKILLGVVKNEPMYQDEVDQLYHYLCYGVRAEPRLKNVRGDAAQLLEEADQIYPDGLKQRLAEKSSPSSALHRSGLYAEYKPPMREQHGQMKLR